MKIFFKISEWVLLVLIFLYLGRTHICLDPFKVRIERPLVMLGWLFCAVRIVYLIEGSRRTGRKEVTQEVIKFVEDQKERNSKKDMQNDVLLEPPL